MNVVLKHLVPGKLTVAPASGTEQAFYAGSQTKPLGAAGTCASNGNVTADSNGYGTSPCTEAQVVKAAKMNPVEVRGTARGRHRAPDRRALSLLSAMGKARPTAQPSRAWQ
ncbi:hypothetical protein [Streptomyces sp. NEAU-L66]|uniref:hypothetical protein n=1 Tax=Streptomyces sp. NEAU-L66 TaxID=3390812 RepID=UPI0039C6782F